MKTSFRMKKESTLDRIVVTTMGRVVSGMKEIVEPQSLASARLQDLTREVLIRLGEDPDRQACATLPVAWSVHLCI